MGGRKRGKFSKNLSEEASKTFKGQVWSRFVQPSRHKYKHICFWIDTHIANGKPKKSIFGITKNRDIHFRLNIEVKFFDGYSIYLLIANVQ